VLYKYLNPHLLIVAVGNSAESILTMYLLDNVSGQILHESKHYNVDILKGVETHIVENVAYWSYHTTGAASSLARGNRISVAEMYESSRKNEKYNT
jgi:ER membrane protein complex subunit 1